MPLFSCLDLTSSCLFLFGFRMFAIEILARHAAWGAISTGDINGEYEKYVLNRRGKTDDALIVRKEVLGLESIYKYISVHSGLSPMRRFRQLADQWDDQDSGL